MQSNADNYEFTFDDIKKYEQEIADYKRMHEWSDYPFAYLFIDDWDNLSDYEQLLKKILIYFYFPHKLKSDDIEQEFINFPVFYYRQEFKLFENISAVDLMKQVLKKEKYQILKLTIDKSSHFLKGFFKSAGFKVKYVGEIWDLVHAKEAVNDWKMDANKFKELNPVAKLLYLYFLVNLFKKHVAGLKNIDGEDADLGDLISEWELGLFPEYFKKMVFLE